MRYLAAGFGGGLQVIEDLSRWSQLERFLYLGSEQGIYYTGGRALTAEDTVALRKCLEQDGLRVVHAILEVTFSGRAPRIEPILVALAMAASPDYADRVANEAALEALPAVVKTGVHLLKFAALVNSLRGWGRGLRSALAGWYLRQPVRELARQMLKQRERGPWSHADVLRLAHPKPATKAQSLLFRWAVEGELSRIPDDLAAADLKQLHGFERARKASERREIVAFIEEYQLTHEMIPRQWLDSAEVWEALLDHMPYCAMLRQLGRLTAVGLIAPQGEATALVAARLVDRGRIARAKASPVTLLATLLKHRRDGGVPAIVAALEEALYISFETIQATGCSFRLLTDAATPVASAAMAMLAARTETNATIIPAVGRRDRVDTVLASLEPLRVGPDSEADAVVVVTGDGCDPRGLLGKRTVLISASGAAPALPDLSDERVLQIVGFDATVPAVVSNFIRQ